MGYRLKSIANIIFLSFSFVLIGCKETKDNSLANENISFSNEKYRDFTLDNIYHSSIGDIHFSSYIPSDYTSRVDMTLYIALPGYEGLYFQGVGTNLKYEEFAFEALKYDDNMIVLAPQLNDWGNRSADEVIALCQCFLNHYPINKNRVFLSGYSGGGETGSIAVSKRPDLFTRFLHVSSKWDGDYKKVQLNPLAIYFFTSLHDSYYGSKVILDAYYTIRKNNQNLTDKEIEDFLILDIKDDEYFLSRGVNDYHGGGLLAAYDKVVMNWLFKRGE